MSDVQVSEAVSKVLIFIYYCKPYWATILTFGGHWISDDNETLFFNADFCHTFINEKKSELVSMANRTDFYSHFFNWWWWWNWEILSDFNWIYGSMTTKDDFSLISIESTYFFKSALTKIAVAIWRHYCVLRQCYSFIFQMKTAKTQNKEMKLFANNSFRCDVNPREKCREN